MQLATEKTRGDKSDAASNEKDKQLQDLRDEKRSWMSVFMATQNIDLDKFKNFMSVNAGKSGSPSNSEPATPN